MRADRAAHREGRPDTASGSAATRPAGRRWHALTACPSEARPARDRGTPTPHAATPSRPFPRPSRPCLGPAPDRAARTMLPTGESRHSRARRRSRRAPRPPAGPAPRISRTVTTPGRLLPLRQQTPDHRLGLVVVALTDVLVANDALAIHHDRGRPGPDAPALPDRVLVVLHDR